VYDPVYLALMGTDPVTYEALHEALARAFGPPSSTAATVSRWHLRRQAHRPGNALSVVASKAGRGVELWVFDPCQATGHTAMRIPITASADIGSAASRIRALLGHAECV
jgi:hypothetical protein